MVHAPMEPLSLKNDPGPGALMTEMSRDEIKDRLNFMLSSFEGYVGINNHMGSKFTANKEGMEVVLETLHKRGLLFLDSFTSTKSLGAKIAQERGMPYAVRHVFLDNSKDKEAINKQLLEVERHALLHHFSVAIGHPHYETTEVLKQWIPRAKEKGFVFVPISQIGILLQDERHKKNTSALNMNED